MNAPVPSPAPLRPAARAPAVRDAVPGQRLAVVTRSGDGLGFRLAGVRVEEIAPGEELGRMKALVAEPALGVIAVESEVMAALPEEFVRHVGQRAAPVLVPFALPRRLGGAGPGEVYVAALIRRAIGYQVKLEPEGGR